VIPPAQKGVTAVGQGNLSLCGGDDARYMEGGDTHNKGVAPLMLYMPIRRILGPLLLSTNDLNFI
jgi:hypothetical protein